MATESEVVKMDKLQLSDEDTEDLWISPSQRRPKSRSGKDSTDSEKMPESSLPRNDDTLYDQEEARDIALRRELESVRNINQVIESVVDSLARAKGNMETVSRTVNSASTLLNAWTRILSQTEHNQRLILNPSWQGATQDMTDIENEAIVKRQAAERKELEQQQRRDAAARKAEEDERRRAEASSRGTRGTRGKTRGLVRTTSTKTSSSTGGQSSTTRGSTGGYRRPGSGIPSRSSGIARGRGRGRGVS
ncbi:hypothetical protein FQN54_008495 [Arachnomyces sp. PD_36]|nr:hypothetical protein FQN54_008495 [Arachnomyces sp. PD_36]